MVGNKRIRTRRRRRRRRRGGVSREGGKEEEEDREEEERVVLVVGRGLGLEVGVLLNCVCEFEHAYTYIDLFGGLGDWGS